MAMRVAFRQHTRSNQNTEYAKAMNNPMLCTCRDILACVSVYLGGSGQLMQLSSERVIVERTLRSRLI